MTDGRDAPQRRAGPEGVPARRQQGEHFGGYPGSTGAPRVEIRTASIRLPGILGLLLAIPAFFVFGLVAIMLMVAGVVGMLIGPWMLRRMLRRMDDEVRSGEATIELERPAYSDLGQAQSQAQDRADLRSGETTIELERSAYSSQDQDRAAINRSSSSRKRGNTSV